MLNVTVASVISRARQLADVETGTPSSSIVTDTDLLAWVNDGYRELYDTLIELGGVELFSKDATVTPAAGVWTLPSDFYQLVALDLPQGGSSTPTPLKPFSVRERNSVYSSADPRYQVRAGKLIFRPTAFNSAVTLWYIPVATTLGANDSFDSLDGWDAFVVAWVLEQILIKQEYATNEAVRLQERALARVRRSVPKIARRDGNAAVVDVMSLPDEWYMG